MMRLYEQSLTRKITSLDMVWDFVTDNENRGLNKKWYENFPQNCEKSYVPSCWNNEYGLENYIGNVWYRVSFVTEKPNIKLVFGAVNNKCDVYLDGKLIKTHEGPFSEFSVILENVQKGCHELILRIDNTLNELDTIPLIRSDWFNFGGIIRSVEVHEFEDTLIDNVKIEYTLSDTLTTADLQIKTDIYSTVEKNDEITVKYEGKQIKKAVHLNSGINHCNILFSMENVRLWDTENPNLYMFEISVLNDSLCERTGFRTIKISGNKFYLNNKEIFFKGINRHENFPECGFAVPFNIVKKDITIIKEMGCNVIRGSHYPNAKTTVDYLDECGILFWEEIPMWGFTEKALKNPKITELGLKLHKEMIVRDYNHPSVIIWGLHNEIETQTQAAYDITSKFIKEIRGYDTTRLITFATMKPAEDICLELADFISLNKYIGWYEGELNDWNKFFDEFHKYLQKFGVDGKPLVISEFGAAAISGNISFEKLRWTENYQAEAMEYMVNLFMKRDDISGMFIWQYADLRTSNTMALERPRSYNNKGIVNEHRRPKMAYYAIKKLFAEGK